MQTILTIIQIVIAIGLGTTILLQQRGTGSSSIFGGGSGGDYYTKRGFEKTIFIATIILAGAFILFAFINLLI